MDKYHLKQNPEPNSHEQIEANLSSNSQAHSFKKVEHISDLENQIQQLKELIEGQKESFKIRELELLQSVDSKKVNWILKYLESKIELDHAKNFYEEGKIVWKKNLKFLYGIIKTLFQQLEKNERKHLETIKKFKFELNNVLEVKANSCLPKRNKTQFSALSQQKNFLNQAEYSSIEN